MDYRVEKDSLGERQVPAGAYYGVQTVRAMENFQVTGIPISHYSRLIQALACIKKAAALSNHELGILEEEKSRAISEACREARQGLLDEHFPVDVIQGGAGTSVNMNANEVICNRALEIMGHSKGDYRYLHPNNHVNLSQSTNDVYPTALRIACIWYAKEFIPQLEELEKSFERKGKEFSDVIKMGRTQLQDAVPMTLGQEFSAFGVTINEDVQRLKEAIKLLQEINMGGTAIGTGINTLPGYSELVSSRLADITGLELVRSGNLVEATSDTGVFVQLSGILKRVGVKLSKICSDLRLLSSGPFTGLRDINLPPVQPGSSIMPGKVNPVIPEMVNQVCYQVIGNDQTVTMASESGQLQLNVFEPIIAFNLFQSLQVLTNACSFLRRKCIDGITANRGKCTEMVRDSCGLATALVPRLGYDKISELAREAQEKGKTIYGLVLEKGLLDPSELDKFLDPASLTTPHHFGEDNS